MRPGSQRSYCYLTLALACLLAGGCGAEDTTQSQAKGSPAGGAVPTPAEPADVCPVRVPGTTVTLVKTKTGGMLFFTTPAGNVKAIRERVARLAQIAQQAVRKDSGSERPGEPAPLRPVWDGRSRARLVPVRVEWSEESDGARLTFTVDDPIHLKELHAYLERHADRMRLGQCDPDFLAVDKLVTARESARAPAVSERAGLGAS